MRIQFKGDVKGGAIYEAECVDVQCDDPKRKNIRVKIFFKAPDDPREEECPSGDVYIDHFSIRDYSADIIINFIRKFLLKHGYFDFNCDLRELIRNDKEIYPDDKKKP